MSNIFELDYLKSTTNLLKESFKMKKYAQMNKFLAILTVILMLPFIVPSVLLGGGLIYSTFLFKAYKMPIDFLHSLLHEEAKDLKGAAQFAVYFLCFPLVFFLYALVALTLIGIIFDYAILALLSYIWTLGGFRFHAFIGDTDQSIEIKVSESYPNSVVGLYVGIFYGLFCAGVFFCLVGLFVEIVLLLGAFLLGLAVVAYFPFTILYGALVMCRKPDVINVADEAEGPVAVPEIPASTENNVW